MRIAVVDDERPARSELKHQILQLLPEAQVDEGENGAQALEIAGEERYDIFFLDINLGDINGTVLVNALKNMQPEMKIIFVTAYSEYAVKAFELEVDDYILKPFSIEELGARVEAHLRREERRRTDRAVKVFDRLAIHYGDHCVYYEEQPLNLTKTEYGIVETLSLNAGQVFSKDQLYEKVRGFDGSADSSIVMEHIRRIRSKIGKYTSHAYIETVWGVGYRWIG